MSSSKKSPSKSKKKQPDGSNLLLTVDLPLPDALVLSPFLPCSLPNPLPETFIRKNAPLEPKNKQNPINVFESQMTFSEGPLKKSENKVENLKSDAIYPSFENEKVIETLKEELAKKEQKLKRKKEKIDRLKKKCSHFFIKYYFVRTFLKPIPEKSGYNKTIPKEFDKEVKMIIAYNKRLREEIRDLKEETESLNARNHQLQNKLNDKELPEKTRNREIEMEKERREQEFEEIIRDLKGEVAILRKEKEKYQKGLQEKVKTINALYEEKQYLELDASRYCELKDRYKKVLGENDKLASRVEKLSNDLNKQMAKSLDREMHICQLHLTQKDQMQIRHFLVSLELERLSAVHRNAEHEKARSKSRENHAPAREKQDAYKYSQASSVSPVKESEQQGWTDRRSTHRNKIFDPKDLNSSFDLYSSNLAASHYKQTFKSNQVSPHMSPKRMSIISETQNAQAKSQYYKKDLHTPPKHEITSNKTTVSPVRDSMRESLRQSEWQERIYANRPEENNEPLIYRSGYHNHYSNLGHSTVLKSEAAKPNPGSLKSQELINEINALLSKSRNNSEQFKKL